MSNEQTKQNLKDVQFLLSASLTIVVSMLFFSWLLVKYIGGLYSVMGALFGFAFGAIAVYVAIKVSRGLHAKKT